MSEDRAPLGKFSRYIGAIPEPFTLSLVLTSIAFVAALSVGQKAPTELTDAWVKGLWSILPFSMQMVLCLCSGFALAQAPVIERALKQICASPKTYAQSVWLVATFSMLLGVIHWGLGLAGGTLLVRQMREMNRERGWIGHAGLMGAAGYLPLMIWHGGLSGSAPLMMASAGHFMEAQTGDLPLSTTIGHWSNLLSMSLMILVMPFICYRWAKNYEQDTAPIIKLHKEDEDDREFEDAPELNARWLGAAVGLAGLTLTVIWVAHLGFAKFGLDQLNAVFLFLGLLCHAKLGSFLRAFKRGVMAAWSVILLFPFYGAIMSLVKDSGLAAMLSETLATTASAATLPLFTFFSAALLNVFVPSGGGQWIVQGPIVISAGKQLGLSPELMVMSVAYGDQLTNMLQPFWALPLLGMTQISSRDLLRFTIPLMFFGGAFMAFTLALRALFGG